MAHYPWLVRVGMFVGVRKVPEAGVKWGEGDLIPPDTLRRCKICKQPIEHLHPSRVCCSHPRCQRANRNNKRHRPGENPNVKRSARSMEDFYRDQEQQKDEALVRKVIAGMAYAKKRGADEVTALAWVAKGTGLSVIQVQDIIRRRGEDPR